MKKTIQLIGVALIWIFATLGCSPDAITNYAEEEIVAEQGGVVVTENGITLEIPAGAFEDDGVVFVGKTGDEPITTNKSPAEWAKSLDDETLATALLDRLLYKCQLIQLTGPSYRMQNRQTIF